MHAGSGNHGCEAIVNSLCRMIKEKAVLVSYRGGEDSKYSLKNLCDIVQERSFDGNKPAHVLYYIYRKLTGDGESFIRYRYHEIFKGNPGPLAVSIGGDCYCISHLVQKRKTPSRICYCRIGHGNHFHFNEHFHDVLLGNCD